MSPIFHSGAFIQQCFVSHPLCLSLMKLASSAQVELTCRSCHLRHRLTLRGISARAAAARPSEEGLCVEPQAAGHLAACVGTHAVSVRVREMDVMQDFVGLRCEACRRLYDLDVAGFESREA